MAVAFKVRIGDLLLELFANTLVLFCSLKAAGTIATCALQALSDRFDYFFIFIKSDRHINLHRNGRVSDPPLLFFFLQ